MICPSIPSYFLIRLNLFCFLTWGCLFYNCFPNTEQNKKPSEITFHHYYLKKKTLWLKTAQCIILLAGGQKSDVGLTKLREFRQNYISLLEAKVPLLAFSSFSCQASVLDSLAQVTVSLLWAPDSTILSPFPNLFLQLLTISYHCLHNPGKYHIFWSLITKGDDSVSSLSAHPCPCALWA